jgi:hypothetical protein
MKAALLSTAKSTLNESGDYLMSGCWADHIKAELAKSRSGRPKAGSAIDHPANRWAGDRGLASAQFLGRPKGSEPVHGSSFKE